MAEGDEQKSSDETSPCPDDAEEPITLDLGIDPAKNFEKIDNDEECAAAASPSVSNDVPRREENPFSFKHFLRGDTTYQSQGARPKVYYDGRQIASISDLELNSTTSSSSLDNKSTRVVSDLGAGLPDFVQDHLVIEQSYLAQATTSTLPNASTTQPSTSSVTNLQHPIIAGLGGGNLPDFTRDSTISRPRTTNNTPDVDSFAQQQHTCTQPQAIARPQPEFPLDLPLPPLQTGSSVATERESNHIDQQNPHNSIGSVLLNHPLLLPDFLTDASLHSHHNTALPLCSVTPNSPAASPNGTLRNHNDHHHNSPPTVDLAAPGGNASDESGLSEAYRRQIAEQARRNAALHGELDVAKQREQEWMMQRSKLEDDMEMSNIRAASAESTIIQLKQEIKALSTQVTLLLREKSSLREKGASCSNSSTSRPSACVDMQLQNFAQELRGAATNAERNLRQLLSGVDNLRMMASYIETSFGMDERPYHSNEADKDRTGPHFK